MKARLLLVLLVFTLFGHAHTQVRQDASAGSSLRVFLSEWEKAQSRFIALGGYGEKGGNAVGARYEYKQSFLLLDVTIFPMALATRNAVPWDSLNTATRSAHDQSDRERLRDLKRAIDLEIGEPRADSLAQCKHIAFGNKPCGGPWTFLVYSTTRTDESKLQRLISEYNALQKKINEEERLASDCSVPTEPELVLEQGVCTAKRN